jgi:tetratricopeptide (TPR) repeat protein
VHVADHHIAPGKKQWTWGNHEFGYAWDRNLADDEAPYIELMAGVFTDNQPDFSWLMPGETRAWSQYWYPIQKVGPVQKANVEGAIALKVEGRRARVGVCATAVLNGARVVVKTRGEVVKELTVDLGPGRPWVGEVDVGEAVAETEVRVAVRDAEGREVVAYQPAPRTQAEVPAAAKEPSLPAEVESVEELYLIGVHLEQYRHATRMPEAYWREALKRDPGESRCHTALGWWHLRRGEFEKAVGHFERAIESLTKFNPNPREGEALYGLGIALRYLGRLDEAYGSLAKAAWNGAWASAAHLVMGQITCRKKEWGKALGHAEESCKMNWEYLQGRLLHALAVRESKTPYGRRLYEQEVEGLERMDLLNAVPRLVRGDGGRADVQTRLDTALELAKMGLWSDALRVLEGAESDAGVEPMVHYYRGYFHEQMGDLEAAGRERGAGKRASSDYCFPVRLEEIDILLSAIAADATDGRAMCYLGNLLYDKKRREEAITWWEKSVRAEAGFSIPWRNLGIAYYNVHRDAAAARGAYERALQAEPGAPRLLYERDQLWKRTGETPSRRLEVLSEHLERVMSRDDLTIEWCALLNQTGQHEAALDVLKHRKFQPWEGGEGMVLAQWVRAHVGLGRKVLLKGEAAGALAIFEAGVGVPTNLGEARHLLANYSELDYWRGVAARKAGDEAGGRKHLERAAAAVGDFRDMAVCAFSEATYFSGRALMELGRVAEARKLFEGMLGYARELAKMPAKIDYFATSLPTMLLFEEDLQARQRMQAALVEALARHGLGEKKAGRQMLQDLVREWPSQSVAADLLEWVELA